MIKLYINLHSSENQPKYELKQNLKDFDKKVDSYEIIFLPVLIFYSLIHQTYHYIQTPPENFNQLSYFGKPLPPPEVMTKYLNNIMCE